MPQIPSGFGYARLEWSTPGPKGIAMSTFGYGTWLPGDANQEAQVIAEDVYGGTGSLFTMIDQSTVLNRVVVYVGQGSGDPAIGTWEGSIASGTNITSHTPQVSLLIQKLSGLSGRRNRGRMYIPGISNTSGAETGVLDGGTVTSLQGIVDTFEGLLQSTTGPMYILHETGASTPTEVTSLLVSPILATQRRRLR